MKYLYVLTSNDRDLYYEQIYLSITSLLLYNPNAYIVLLTDDKTCKNLKGRRGKILHLVHEYKVIEFSVKYSQKIRSRLLKTSMRNIVDGDFLYLDCDTIILSPIDIPLDWNFNIGAVKNLHFSNVKDSPIYPIFYCLANKCGINMGSFDYFNGGVLYVKDNCRTRAFFSHWHELYLQYLENNGVEIDQLSLYKANNDFYGLIEELQGEWNWQVGFGLNYISNAKIMHTFSSVANKLHNIHFLKRQEFYLNMKKHMYSNREIIDIIKCAKTSFDETVRIVPTTFGSIERAVVDFCSRFNQVLVYGIEEYFLRISCLLQQLWVHTNVIGFVPFEQSVQKFTSMGMPYLSFDDLQCQKQELGIVVAMDIQRVNIVLSSLITRGFTNLFIFN